jgi:hypothetical protein
MIFAKKKDHLTMVLLWLQTMPYYFFFGFAAGFLAGAFVGMASSIRVFLLVS